MFFPPNLVLRGHNDSIGQFALPLVQQSLPRGGNLVWVQPVELLHPDWHVKVVFCLNSQLHNNDLCPTIPFYSYCNICVYWIRSFAFFFCAQLVLPQPQLSSCQEENDHLEWWAKYFPITQWKRINFPPQTTVARSPEWAPAWEVQSKGGIVGSSLAAPNHNHTDLINRAIERSGYGCFEQLFKKIVIGQ